MLLPTLKRPQAGSRDIAKFLGLNRLPGAEENQFRDMENLWGGDYPLLSTRPRRGTAAALTAPQGILTKDALLYVDAGKVIYNGAEVTGLTLTPTGDKQIVSMGAYAVFFPDKKYLNTADLGDYGALEASWAASDTTKVKYELCRADGSAMTAKYIQAADPGAASNGDIWIDTSEKPHRLKQYAADSSAWVTVPTVYCKLTAAGIGAKFKEGDGVELSGAAYTGPEPMKSQVADLNGTKLLYGCGNDYLILVGILDEVYEQTGGVTVKRETPDMDYVTECGNRIWGCKYGLVGGETRNEIYACKLGDFKNWRCYQGISTDSYTASRGADGQFTGAITYQGHPIFFRERSFEIVYPDAGGAHQITTNESIGVQAGSWRSLAIAGSTLLYKSPEGVCAYTGSMPYSVSEALGPVMYRDARAGALGNRYYLSMQDAAGKWTMMVYDLSRGVWHKEDAVKAQGFAACGGDLFFLREGDAPALCCALGTTGTKEGPFHWLAETGLIGLGDYQRKYVTRLSVRGAVEAGTVIEFYVQYDSTGEWVYGGELTGSGMGSFLLPIRPRRCDHARLRLCGKGGARIFSIHETYEKGSDAG